MNKDKESTVKENRTQKFIYNSLTTIIYQLVVMIVGFIIPRIMLYYYGSEINGLISSVTQFISYFSLVEAGLSGAAIYSLYEPLAQKNNKEISRIIVAVKKFYNQSGIIFFTLVLALSIVYPIFIKSELLSFKLIVVLIVILGMKGTLEFFSLAKYRAILTADQKTYVISISSTIYVILNAIIVVVMSFLKFNIVVVNLIAISALFVRSIILKCYVSKNYEINYNEEPNFKALDKRWHAFYLQILGVVQTGAPIVLATIFTNIKSVSVYSIYNMVVSGINGIMNIFTSGLSATFGDLLIRKENERFKSAYSDFEYVYYIILTIIYSISLILIMPFIRIYTNGVTDTNYYLPILGFLMVINGVLYNIKTPQGMLVISAGLYKETRIQSTIQALIIVIPGCILTIMFGLNGIVIASCLSNLYRIIDLLFFTEKYITHIPKGITIRRIVRMILNMLVVYCITLKLDMKILTIFDWIKDGIIIGIITSIIVIIDNFVLEKNQMLSVYKRIINILRIKELI